MVGTPKIRMGGKSIPPGYILGRTSGKGTPELIPISTLTQQSFMPSGSSPYTASSGITLTGYNFTITNYGTGTAIDGISGWSGTGLIRRTGVATYSFGTAVGLTTEVTGILPVANGGTGLASGTSGGIPAYTGSTTITSSGVLAAGAIVMGGGAAAVPATEADWTFSSHNLIGNFNAASLPAAPSGGTSHLRIGGLDGTVPAFLIDGFAASTFIIARRSQGTAASPTALANNNTILSFLGYGYGATGYSSASRVGFGMRASEAWTDSAQGTRIELSTTAIGTTTTAVAGTIATAGCSFNGTNTNDSAAAGVIGEYVESILLIASEVGLTSATPADITSISLTAGDWKVWAELWTDPAAGTTITTMHGWISPTSATLPTVPATNTSRTTIRLSGVANNEVFPVAACRQSLTTTTTIYLGAQITFAVSTLAAYGKICARRMR